jgi:uncharacterized protein (TIGR00255 family)
MTGYGKAKTQSGELDLEFEIKSVNGRYLDMKIYLPREISFFEYKIRQMFSSSFSRGTMEVRTSFADHREPRIKLNQNKLSKYYDIFSQAKHLLNLDDTISLELLLNEPGIIENDNNLEEDELLNTILNSTLEQAIEALDRSLSAEASQIRQVLMTSCDKMLQAMENIEIEIQPYKEELFAGMKARTAELLQSFNTENIEQRLFQELAIYIDRYDIQEELTRLRGHIETLRSVLDKKEDIGKSLNFILQEMQRESNTLGSKFSTAKTFQHILILKEEVEKCREIVQNVA